MALYTGKGDGGTTKTFGCDQRISKSSAVAEALGTLDEVNSYLGLCKVQSRASEFIVGDVKIADIVHELQDDLFIVQAEVAGAPKTIPEQKVHWQEDIIHTIEKELPPIKTFFISGGCELSSVFDMARTLARRAERRVVGVHEEGIQEVGAYTLAYLNRLSSTLYALARYANHQRGIVEKAPDYV
jgi:cob(I)alamin adenosyltransferase